MEVIDISSLNDRYGINRNAVNDRINTLKIKRSRRGKISPEDLELMDRYHEHIQRGGTILNFALSPEVVVPEKFEVATNNKSAEVASYHLAGGLYCLADTISSKTVEYNPIKNMQLLQESARECYILSTKQLKELCGAKPTHNSTYGKFRFIKSETKVGKSFGWEVKDIRLQEVIEGFKNDPKRNAGVVAVDRGCGKDYTVSFL